jgi:hypothetical protein
VPGDVRVPALRSARVLPVPQGQQRGRLDRHLRRRRRAAAGLAGSGRRRLNDGRVEQGASRRVVRCLPMLARDEGRSVAPVRGVRGRGVLPTLARAGSARARRGWLLDPPVL